jgi:hypothetical protein
LVGKKVFKNDFTINKNVTGVKIVEVPWSLFSNPESVNLFVLLL